MISDYRKGELSPLSVPNVSSGHMQPCRAGQIVEVESSDTEFYGLSSQVVPEGLPSLCLEIAASSLGSWVLLGSFAEAAALRRWTPPFQHRYWSRLLTGSQ